MLRWHWHGDKRYPEDDEAIGRLSHFAARYDLESVRNVDETTTEELFQASANLADTGSLAQGTRDTIEQRLATKRR